MTKRKAERPPETPWESPVVLKGPSEQPIVLRVPVDVLTAGQYQIVAALISAGKAGLSLRDLIEATGRPAPEKTLGRLAGSTRLWKAVIHMAGRSYGRYRIDWPDRDDAVETTISALSGNLPDNPAELRRLARRLHEHGILLLEKAARVADLANDIEYR